jgi:hypothetical protein
MDAHSIVSRNIDEGSIGLLDDCKPVINLLFVTYIKS